MAYLFLSQHHKANAGEWSCETYCSKDYREFVCKGVSTHTLDTHSKTIHTCCFLIFHCLSALNIFCLEFDFATIKWYIFLNIVVINEVGQWLFKKQQCIEWLLAIKTCSCFHMDGSLIKFVLRILFKIIFEFVLTLCSKPNYGPNACRLASKTQLTNERRVLG